MPYVERASHAPISKRSLKKAARPADWFAIAIRHNAVKLSGVAGKHKWQEMAVALPQRQLQYAVDFDPFQRPLGVLTKRLAPETVHAENEAKPILAAPAETGPADGAFE